MIKVGIIGGGFMARTHARAVRTAGGQVAGVCARNLKSATTAAAQIGAERPYATLSEMLADPDLDVIHVCSPNSAHKMHVLAAIEAGKHVVCEKPLATTLADALELQTAADAADVITVVPFVYRFHPMVREARSRIAHAGQLFSIQGAYLQDWLALPTDDDWRADPAVGGPSRAFADIGSHLIDLVEFVTQQRIIRLQAITRAVYSHRGGRPASGEDVAAVLAETENGAIASLLVSQVSAGHKNDLTIEIATGDGAFRFQQEQPDTLWIGSRTGTTILSRDGLNSPDAVRLNVAPAGHPIGYPDAFAALISDMHAAIRGTSSEGLPTFSDGVRAAAITEAVLRSASLGQWVQPSPS